MGKPTICVECGRHEEEKDGACVSGTNAVTHLCMIERKKLDYVTGKTYVHRYACASLNNGNCDRWIPKEPRKEEDDERKAD